MVGHRNAAVSVPSENETIKKGHVSKKKKNRKKKKSDFRRRTATAGLGAGHEVALSDDDGNGVALDGRGARVAGELDGVLDDGAEVLVVPGGDGQGRAGARHLDGNVVVLGEVDGRRLLGVAGHVTEEFAFDALVARAQRVKRRVAAVAVVAVVARAALAGEAVVGAVTTSIAATSIAATAVTSATVTAITSTITTSTSVVKAHVAAAKRARRSSAVSARRRLFALVGPLAGSARHRSSSRSRRCSGRLALLLGGGGGLLLRLLGGALGRRHVLAGRRSGAGRAAAGLGATACVTGGGGGMLLSLVGHELKVDCCLVVFLRRDTWPKNVLVDDSNCYSM